MRVTDTVSSQSLSFDEPALGYRLPGFLTNLVRTVRSVVHAPVLQGAVLTVIDRFQLVMDVLTGVHRHRPAMQQKWTGFNRLVLSPNKFSPDIPLFSGQR
jgi:hypothetical protein